MKIDWSSNTKQFSINELNFKEFDSVDTEICYLKTQVLSDQGN